MNKIIDRDEITNSLKIIFHKHNILLIDVVLNDLLDFIEEQTDFSFNSGQKDIIKYLKDVHNFTFIKNDISEIAYFGNIDEENNIIEGDNDE